VYSYGFFSCLMYQRNSHNEHQCAISRFFLPKKNLAIYYDLAMTLVKSIHNETLLLFSKSAHWHDVIQSVG